MAFPRAYPGSKGFALSMLRGKMIIIGGLRARSTVQLDLALTLTFLAT